jgi:hypothetical protein
MSKNVVHTEGTRMTSQYGAYALRARFARLYARMRMHTPTCPGIQCTHAHSGQYVILFFHSNNGFMNAPQCYVIHTLPALFNMTLKRRRDAIESVRFIVSINRTAITGYPGGRRLSV